MSKGKKKVSYISAPSSSSQTVSSCSSSSSSSLQSLLLLNIPNYHAAAAAAAAAPPKKLVTTSNNNNNSSSSSSRKTSSGGGWKTWWFVLLFLVTLIGMVRLGYNLDPIVQSFPSSTKPNYKLQAQAATALFSTAPPATPPLIINNSSTSSSEEEEEEEELFWKQPDGMGFKGCLKFSREYMRETEEDVILRSDRRKYVVVVVSGGLNQQRNQIVDAVIIARILGAALVVPVLQVNLIWADESEFSDIFDLEHFKKVLANDIRVVSSLPSNHLRTRPLVDNLNSHNLSPDWIRARLHKRLEKVGVLLLRSLDSKLSKDLPSDLQKLRCKVAFHALKFAPSILELGNRLAQRMRSRGPYLALHLRMEKDVWVRTGCLPGLSPKYDKLINMERQRHPELLTARSNITFHQRKLAGLCPLNALEVTRLLKALGAPKNARIYWAGGEPLGGKEALLPLITHFPNFYNKQDLALPGELEPFRNRASSMAAIDYIICEKSDVFMPSHGGNMGHALQGQRAYAGHHKYITPNKRQMTPYFFNTTLPQPEFNRIIKLLHKDSVGQPDLKTGKLGRDVTKFPIPHCMCRKDSTTVSSYL